MVGHRGTLVAVDPEFILGSDTAAACWLCNRGTGELCHVHDPGFVRTRLERETGNDELGGVVLNHTGVEDAHDQS